MRVFCHCRKCNQVVQHNRTEEANRFQCVLCATVRFYAEQFGAGDFPELTFDENEDIHEARATGFAISFPAIPDAKSQAKQTLRAARAWLADHSN